MFDTKIRAVTDPIIDWVSRPLIHTKISANNLTVIGFFIGMCTVPALAWQEYTLALILIIINRTSDGLDGIHARRTSPSQFGGYLDIVLDFLFYSAVVFGFALADSANALAAAWLIFSFVGTGTSFLAYAIVAEKLSISQAASQNKWLHYLGGLTEGTETILFFIVICLFPHWFQYAAWLFGVMCWLTTAQRIYVARLHFDSI